MLVELCSQRQRVDDEHGASRHSSSKSCQSAAQFSLSAFGCVGALPMFATAAEKALVGCALAAKETMEEALLAIDRLEIEPITHYHSIRQSEGKDPFRRVLPATFLYKFMYEETP